MTTIEKNDIKFEEAMARLESISSRLADEGAPLDEAISLYEEGVVYYKICRQKLDDATRRIKVIEEGAEANEE